MLRSVMLVNWIIPFCAQHFCIHRRLLHCLMRIELGILCHLGTKKKTCWLCWRRAYWTSVCLGTIQSWDWAALRRHHPARLMLHHYSIYSLLCCCKCQRLMSLSAEWAATSLYSLYRSFRSDQSAGLGSGDVEWRICNRRKSSLDWSFSRCFSNVLMHSYLCF